MLMDDSKEIMILLNVEFNKKYMQVVKPVICK